MTSSSASRVQPPASLSRLLLSAPVGPLLAEYTPDALCRLRFWPQRAHPPAGARVQTTRDDPLGWRIAEQIREYFAGSRRGFDLPLALHGTDFQGRIWAALVTIPYGVTVSYAELGEWVGTTNARAVGQAVARNPLPIVLPCHRVLTAGGGLGGFMGQGPDGEGAQIKRGLLRHEGVVGF